MRRRVLLGAAFATPALAQSAWPLARPVRVIVPFPPGAANDAMGRLFAQKLQEKLGATAVVENRPGGSALIGTRAVLEAAPDGYTFLASALNHTILHLVLKDVGFDPQADFEPVARTGAAPQMLVMAANRPERTLAAVVTSAKERPRDWTFAVPALGAPGHLATIAFNRRVGVDIEMTSYRGTAPALTDVVAGNVQLLFDASFALLPAARDGRVRALGLATAARSPVAPEVPTLAEAGLPGFEFGSWYGIWAPKGTPAAITERANAMMREVMAEAEVADRLTRMSIEPVRETIPEMRAFVVRSVAQSAELLRAVNWQPQ